MSEIWFTADCHFGHANIIKPDYCDRPFANIWQHDEGLTSNWNEVVAPKDEVYVLGDFTFRNHQKYLDRLNGHVHLILGNHDKRKDAQRARFVWVKDVFWMKLKPDGIFLSHYAHRRWPKSHRGSYHFFAHSHGNLEPFGRSCDVGVDCWSYYPVHIDTLLAKLKSSFSTEHHPGR